MKQYTKTPKEIDLIHEGGKLLGDILRRTAKLAKAGVSTLELNQFAETEIKKAFHKLAKNDGSYIIN